MKNQIIKDFEESVALQRKVHPKFRPGDQIRVNYKVEDSAKDADGTKKFRVQVFEGVCISYKKGTMAASFAVRKMSANAVGVERIFPLHSPFIDSIELISGGRVRRAKLYYLRDLSGKSARIRSRRLASEMLMTSVDEAGTEGPAFLQKVDKDERKKAHAAAAKGKKAKPKK